MSNKRVNPFKLKLHLLECEADEKDKKIADLEAKLADSEKLKELYRLQDNDHHSKLWQFYSRLGVEAFGADIHEKALEELEKLKQQLAEKEQEIEVLKQRLKDTIKIYSEDFVEKDKELKELRFQARNIFPLVENLEDKIHQDKISFCIEQLVWLKEKVNNAKIHKIDMINTHELYEILNNQIKQLKEGK